MSDSRIFVVALCLSISCMTNNTAGSPLPPELLLQCQGVICPDVFCFSGVYVPPNRLIGQCCFTCGPKLTLTSPVACPGSGQVFSNCFFPCPTTCREPDLNCLPVLPCTAGCQCPSGTVLDQDKNACVTRDECTETGEFDERVRKGEREGL